MNRIVCQQMIQYLVDHSVPSQRWLALKSFADDCDLEFGADASRRVQRRNLYKNGFQTALLDELFDLLFNGGHSSLPKLSERRGCVCGSCLIVCDASDSLVTRH